MNTWTRSVVGNSSAARGLGARSTGGRSWAETARLMGDMRHDKKLMGAFGFAGVSTAALLAVDWHNHKRNQAQRM